MSEAVKYPNVKVKLIGADGNAFSIIGKVKDALRKNNVDPKEIALFQKQAMSGDYNNLLRTCMEWVKIVQFGDLL